MLVAVAEGDAHFDTIYACDDSRVQQNPWDAILRRIILLICDRNSGLTEDIEDLNWLFDQKRTYTRLHDFLTPLRHCQVLFLA